MATTDRRLVVLFDGGCPLCRRSVRTLHALDWLGRLEFADASDPSQRERVAPGLAEDDALTEMYVIGGSGQRLAGYDGYVELARVVPLMAPLRLLHRVPGFAALGRAIYRRVAASRVRRGRCSDELCSRLALKR